MRTEVPSTLDVEGLHTSYALQSGYEGLLGSIARVTRERGRNTEGAIHGRRGRSRSAVGSRFGDAVFWGSDHDVLEAYGRLRARSWESRYNPSFHRGELSVIDRLRARADWQFAGVLARADLGLAAAWWALLTLRGLLPALFAIAMGWLIGTIELRGDLWAPLAVVGRDLRALAGLDADPPGRELLARQPDIGLALRPAHRRLRRAAGHGPS